MTWTKLAIALALAGLVAACDGDETSTGGAGGSPPSWQLVHQDLPGALLSIWGSSDHDVWIVGGDARDGSGPLVIHYDGSRWERIQTGLSEGDLWWVFGFAGGPIYMGGAGGVILRYQDGAFSVMTTPSSDTVFGIWGASESDVWAVGGSFDTNGFAWRLMGDSWEPEPTLPSALVADAAIWKVFGRSADEVWLVGSDGVSLSYDGTSLSQAATGVGSSLFTVHGNAQRFVAVGGLASGIIVENDGSGWSDALLDTPAYGLTGVVLAGADGGYAVGQYGSMLSRSSSGWQTVDNGLSTVHDLHGVWVDPAGGVWAVGGLTASFPLVEGLLIHRGDTISSEGL